jgi:hypothetical protein
MVNHYAAYFAGFLSLQQNDEIVPTQVLPSFLYQHRDLGVRMITAEIKRTSKKHEDRLHQHTNVEAIQLLDNCRAVRMLNRL